MPLSDHEQRMLDQIESALYAEDPKFASSVRGGTLRAPSTRRRLQGAALFVIGLAMLVAGIAIPATRIGDFAILSVIGFIVMFGGVVFAITRPAGCRRQGPVDRRAGSGAAEACQGRQGLGRLVHQPHGGPVPPSFRRVGPRRPRGSPQPGYPFFVRAARFSRQVGSPTTPHLIRHGPSSWGFDSPLSPEFLRVVRSARIFPGEWGRTEKFGLLNGVMWGIVG